MTTVRTISRRDTRYTRRVPLAEMFRNCAYSYAAGFATFPVLYVALEIWQGVH